MRRKRLSQGVGALNDPAVSAIAALALDRLRFLDATADVRGEAELFRERVHLRVVVALVQAEALRRLRRRPGSLDLDALDRRAGELEVVQVRARWRDPERDPLTLGEERSLRPFFALSVGFGPVSAPPSGALPIAPSIPSHSHSIPCLSS